MSGVRDFPILEGGWSLYGDLSFGGSSGILAIALDLTDLLGGEWRVCLNVSSECVVSGLLVHCFSVASRLRVGTTWAAAAEVRKVTGAAEDRRVRHCRLQPWGMP